MKLKLFLLSLAPFMPLIATAGEIRGILTKEGQPVPNTMIKIAAQSTTTDKFGSYRIFVPEKGECTVTVIVKDEQPPSATVNSFDRSVQYDLMLERKDGKYTLTVK